jgi:hypothetical protein
VSDLRAGLEQLEQELRAFAIRERNDHWCNTEDAPLWRTIHEHRGDVFDACASRVAALLQGGVQCCLGKPDTCDTHARRCSTCQHKEGDHEQIWDPEAEPKPRAFGFCHACARAGKKYPVTHHNFQQRSREAHNNKKRKIRFRA